MYYRTRDSEREESKKEKNVFYGCFSSLVYIINEKYCNQIHIVVKLLLCAIYFAALYLKTIKINYLLIILTTIYIYVNDTSAFTSFIIFIFLLFLTLLYT
jgi:hypothetical protein